MEYVFGIIVFVIVIIIGLIYSFKLFKTVGKGLGKSNRDNWGMNYTDKDEKN